MNNNQILFEEIKNKISDINNLYYLEEIKEYLLTEIESIKIEEELNLKPLNIKLHKKY